MKKKVLAGMLVALAVCSVTACGKKNDKEASVVSGSVITAESLESETSQADGSQTPEAAGTEPTGSQTPEASGTEPTGSQTPEASGEEQTSSQAPETASANQTAGTQTVPAGISLDEDMSSVSYTLLARMISEQEGNAAYDVEAKTNGDSFWKELNYLVSIYGVNDNKITFDEEAKEYIVKKEQLRYYAASLYSDLGKAKKLPEIADGSTSVTKKGSKWRFSRNDTSAYDVSVQSCSKQQKDGTYQLSVYLVDSAANTSLGEYTAVIKKSPYKSSKCPFHYTIVSLNKMTKMDMETVLVGDQQENSDSTSQAGLTAGTDTSSSDGSTTQQDGQTTPTGTSEGTGTAGGDASQAVNSDIAGATITSDAAMEIAKKYYGAAADDGTAYTYTYQGATTYQNIPYYNFCVTKDEDYVINVLVSGDGARIYKGTNTNDSWTMQ